MAQNSIYDRLSALQDVKYKQFQCRLMPTVNPDTVIGVRTPALRAFAKEIAGSPAAENFLNTLPHRFYEENNLHAFLIELMPDYDVCLSYINRFLPYVDNWATCDGMSPKVFKKHLNSLTGEIDKWLKSSDVYTVRFGIKMLMTHYLDEHFKCEYLSAVAEIKSDEYYIKMMQAWFFATALAKQYSSAVPFITDRKLDVWVHNKTIQKAVESYRLTNTQKQFLRGLKIKEN